MAEPITVIGPSLMPCRAVLDVNIMPAYQMPDLRGKRPADLAGAISVRRVSHRRQPEFKKRNKAVCWCFTSHIDLGLLFVDGSALGTFPGVENQEAI